MTIYGMPVQEVTMKGSLHNCVDSYDAVLAPCRQIASASGRKYNDPAAEAAG